jgi:prepilin-type N-terminal cleavage/methylation domain-containing protein
MISMRVKAASRRESSVGRRYLAAFTLIEIMVVVGIMGMIMAMGVPTLYKMLHREGFGKTVTSITDACSTARARAIIGGRQTALVFQAVEDGTTQFHVQSGGAGGWGTETLNGQLPDDIAIESFRVSTVDCMGFDRVVIRFFPNGTCDEMELVLYQPRTGERRRISLELTTGLASRDSDRSHWR